MEPSDSTDFVTRLRHIAENPHDVARKLFAAGIPIFVARAPGRLDVMGGIGDYSGSLVLELPIAEAAFIAAQATTDGTISVVSLPQTSGDAARLLTLSRDAWTALTKADYDSVRRELQKVASTAWAAYVLGPVLVLMREVAARRSGGLRILVDSRVPEGKGVSSSAAIEVATMRAAAALAKCELSGFELARLCQIAENRVVGAPCGIMDQMTSALGQQDQLLAIRCQPATVEGHASIPRGVSVWGIDSGIRHEVSGADYGSVRTGAFMGYRMIAQAAGLQARVAGGASGAVEIDDPLWGGYLANITPSEFLLRFADLVPRKMDGQEFLASYGGTTDHVTTVDPTRSYAVHAPTFYPIGENERVHQFRDLLAGEITESAMRKLGSLMYAAHESYSACGLGSDGTDLLVQLVRERGPESGLYGAKITGGGSGGTVAILGRDEADPVIDEIARDYESRCGRETYIFRGSSPGACATEVVEVII